MRTDAARTTPPPYFAFGQTEGIVRRHATENGNTHCLVRFVATNVFSPVEGDLRAVFYVERNYVVAVDIGTHDLYERDDLAVVTPPLAVNTYITLSLTGKLMTL